MLTPLSIVSLDQGKQAPRGEDEYYADAGAKLPHERLAGRMMQLLRMLRSGAARERMPGQAVAPVTNA